MESSIRSNFYDTLPDSLERLSRLSKNGNDILKSEASDKFQQFVTVNNESVLLGKLIQSQYAALRRDWLKKAINSARYVGSLQPIAAFIDQNPDVILPEGIAEDVKKYIR